MAVSWQASLDVAKCSNPQCEHKAHPDIETYKGYCCDKCEARANGEEWAMDIKKMHSKTCTSKFNVGFLMGSKCAHPDCKFMVTSEPTYNPEFCCGKCEELLPLGPGAASGGKRHHKYCEKIVAAKCAHPECNFRVNSDPYVSEEYCCGQCEGLHKGEEWAANSTKRHFKNCEQQEHGKLPTYGKRKSEDWEEGESYKKSKQDNWAGKGWGKGQQNNEMDAAMSILMLAMMGNQGGYNSGKGSQWKGGKSPVGYY